MMQQKLGNIRRNSPSDISQFSNFAIGLMTVFEAVLTSWQRLRRRGYQFPYILCKKSVNETWAIGKMGFESPKDTKRNKVYLLTLKLSFCLFWSVKSLRSLRFESELSSSAR